MFFATRTAPLAAPSSPAASPSRIEAPSGIGYNGFSSRRLHEHQDARPGGRRPFAHPGFRPFVRACGPGPSGRPPRIQGTRRRVRGQGPGAPAQGVREDQGRLSRDPLPGGHRRQHPAGPGRAGRFARGRPRPAGRVHGQGTGHGPPPQSQHDGRPARQSPQPRGLRRPEGPGRRPELPGPGPPDGRGPGLLRGDPAGTAGVLQDLCRQRRRAHRGPGLSERRRRGESAGFARHLPQVRRRDGRQLSLRRRERRREAGPGRRGPGRLPGGGHRGIPGLGRKGPGALHEDPRLGGRLRGRATRPRPRPCRSAPSRSRPRPAGRGRPFWPSCSRARSVRRASGPISLSTRSSRPSRPNTWPSSSITCPFPGPTR